MTSHIPASPTLASGTHQPREAVRRKLSPTPGKATLDGAPDHPTADQTKRLAADAHDDEHDEQDAGDDETEHWTDEGDNWWPNPEAGPPSFR